MTRQTIDGKLQPNDAAAIWDAGGLVESALNGHATWRTAEITLTDANCTDPDVRGMATWLLENQIAGVRVVDRRTCK